MTDLYLDQLSMPTAAVGPNNPLPPIRGDASLNKSANLEAASDAIRTNAAYGRVDSIAPYLTQDGYLRERAEQNHPVAVLENDHLRATFLLAHGGRLWSLIDRATGAELLYRNPIFQPANLGVRSAWFAGGVEWNIGTIGHTPLTCAPMHAARVIGDDGVPVLRLYEFERLRRVVYQLDVHLPPESRALYVHVRITNPNDVDVPMYWWSNIAVSQAADTRVLTPATHTWNYSYDNILRHDEVAPKGSDHEYDNHEYDNHEYDNHEYDNDRYDGVASSDISYPARFSDAADFFFDLDATDLEATGRPWIVAVDGSGTGLAQTSTGLLTGRKLFRWGTSVGGQRWQQWLSGELDSELGGYAEIQAGLAATQFEHVRLPAGESWSWTESYGPIQLDAAAAHGPWDVARAAAQDAVIAAVSSDVLAWRHRIAGQLADREPESLLHKGSGWGALERTLRTRAGEPPVDRPGTPFADSAVGDEQQPWLELLETSRYPDLAPEEYPGSVHLHPVLVEALAASPGWAAAALLGVARAVTGDWSGAREAWQESLRSTENPYARRNLAVRELRNGDPVAACEHYLRALADLGIGVDGNLSGGASAIGGDMPGGPHRGGAMTRPLVVEALAALVSAGHHQVLPLIDSLPDALRQDGRVRFAEAAAALSAGEIDRCGEILADESLAVADLREGEDSLDELWWDYVIARWTAERGSEPTAAQRAAACQALPLPPHLDFRMKPSEASA